jgi:hypothetical protein
MSTFDELLPSLAEILQDHMMDLQPFLPILINRNLYGHICLILDAKHHPNPEMPTHPLFHLAEEVSNRLSPHVKEVSQIFMFEEDPKRLMKSGCAFGLFDRNGQVLPDVYVMDRLAQEATWESIEDISPTSPRVVYYSINGGVERTNTVMISALSLAKEGKRVMVIDLDFESPGFSSFFLDQNDQPAFGIIDWLVEDLVNNGDAVIQNLHTNIPISCNGEIVVVPAHGLNPGEYISKLGRVYMPTFRADGSRQMWSARLNHLLGELEQRHQPDIILIDSCTGINEFSSACLTDLGAKKIYLFAPDELQSWSNYLLLFQHWHQLGVTQKIRERLQFVRPMMSLSHKKQFYNFCKTYTDKNPIFVLLDPPRPNLFQNFNKFLSEEWVFGDLISDLKKLI